LSQSTRLTDGQTDRILIARPRLHSMQRGKKVVNFLGEEKCTPRQNPGYAYGTMISLFTLASKYGLTMTKSL